MKRLFLLLFSLSVVAGTVHAQAVRLFDGQTMKGWKVSDPAYSHLWKVSDGMLAGGDGKQKIPANTYLCTVEEYANFEFRCLFKLSGDPATGMINSGIQYRSTIHDNNMVGYQADIGDGFWGDIYDEHRRGKLVSGNLAVLKSLLFPNGWNSYIVRCNGNRHELYINGVKTADYVEKDTKVPGKGIIGLQLHSGGVAQLFVKDVEIEKLP